MRHYLELQLLTGVSYPPRSAGGLGSGTLESTGGSRGLRGGESDAHQGAASPWVWDCPLQWRRMDLHGS